MNRIQIFRANHLITGEDAEDIPECYSFLYSDTCFLSKENNKFQLCIKDQHFLSSNFNYPSVFLFLMCQEQPF